MEDEEYYYQLEHAIKNINLIKINKEKNLDEEEIKKSFGLKSDSKIYINKDFGLISYGNHKFEEYFLDDENCEDNKYSISKIQYRGTFYKEEFLGFKFYCNDKILILSKEPNKYSTNFTFHEVNVKDNNNKNDNKNNNDNNKDINKNINNDKNKDNKNKDTNKYNKIKNKNDDYKNNYNNNEKNNEYYYNFIRNNMFDKID